jgi:hypothetical protein
MNLCVTVEGSPQVNALPSSSSSKWPEMSNKINPVSLLPHLVLSLRAFVAYERLKPTYQNLLSIVTSQWLDEGERATIFLFCATSRLVLGLISVL